PTTGGGGGGGRGIGRRRWAWRRPAEGTPVVLPAQRSSKVRVVVRLGHGRSQRRSRPREGLLVVVRLGHGKDSSSSFASATPRATYDRWIHHGEPLHAEPGHQPDAHHADEGGEHLEDDHVVLENSFNLVEEDGDEDDRIPDLFKDLYESEPQGDGQNTIYAELIEEAKRSASDGGTISRFAFTVKLLHVKSFYRMSNAALNGILHLLAIQYPKSSIPKNYDEALSIIGRLGLGYESIHVCPNNCVLFRKTYAKLDKCPKCDASRWKDGDGRKQIPEKVLRYFPIIPRLQRMFISKKQSEEVQWHKLKRKPVTNELSHPADGKAWKDFDSQHKDFAADARNIRLGLATDGFNPFGMSRKYSMWPVFIVPYNLPPWACMDRSNFMMALLIPGPDSPGKDFDIFMEPLVEDLFKLWNGVQTYDAPSPDKFNLRAAVIWCIHDFPALHTLSGRLTAGYQACVRCDKDPCSERIRNKLCWIGSRRFLPLDHHWRKSKGFNGNTEPRDPPAEFTKEELKQQLDKVKDVRPGKNQKKRKREEGQCWDRRSILWDLPYWADLKLRYNLDVMHIEKNICDNLLGTFMNIDGKSKDTLNSRLDLEDMGIREALHLRPVDGGKSFEMPEAWSQSNHLEISNDKEHEEEAARRKAGGKEGSATTAASSASAITQAESSDYVPRDEEVIDEEVDDNIVDKTVKALKVTKRKKKSAVRKKNKNRKSPEDTSSQMGPGRIFAVPPGGSKRLLELETPAPARVTRQKAKAVAAAIHEDNDEEEGSTVRMEPSHVGMELSSVRMEPSHVGMELSPVRMEPSHVGMEQSPVAPFVDRNTFPEETEQATGDEDDAIVAVKRIRKGKGLERMTKSMGSKVTIEIAEGMNGPENPLQAAMFASECGYNARTHTPGNFDMDTKSPAIKKACTEKLQKISKNRRHQIKKDFFDNAAPGELSIKSPVEGLPDDQWQELLKLWSTERHKKEERNGEELSALDLFKATQNSTKNGFSETAKIAIAEMERRMNQPVPEGQHPMSDVQVVGQVLKEKCPASTFLVNVGLESRSSATKSTAMSAHVRDLKDKLARSEMQGEAMREEVAALKKKSEESDAAQAARDAQYELLLKKTQEQEEKFNHFIALFGARAIGN
ncbi:hypothetical protein QYE76_019374, partial [Lolium multiflorum]